MIKELDYQTKAVDELVVRMQERFNQRAFPELLCEILMMFDEMLKPLVMRKRPIPFSCGCGGDSRAAVACSTRNQREMINRAHHIKSLASIMISFPMRLAISPPASAVASANPASRSSKTDISAVRFSSSSGIIFSRM